MRFSITWPACVMFSSWASRQWPWSFTKEDGAARAGISHIVFHVLGGGWVRGISQEFKMS